MNKMGKHLGKITALLISAAMIIGQAGMPVSAVPLYNDQLVVAGVNLTTDGQSVGTNTEGVTAGTATLTYDNAGYPILTLDNFTYTGGASPTYYFSVIYYDGADPLIIRLSGTSSLAPMGLSPTVSYGVYSAKALTIENAPGTVGALSVTAADASITNPNTQSVGIFCADSLTVKNGTVTANGGTAHKYSYGIRSGSVTVNGGTVIATGGSMSNSESGSFGIGSDSGDVTLNGGVMTATGGTAVTQSYGVYCGESGSITLNGGTVISRYGNGGSAGRYNNSPVIGSGLTYKGYNGTDACYYNTGNPIPQACPEKLFITNTNYTTHVESLAAAIANRDCMELRLEEDFEIGDEITIDRNFTLDLNGHVVRQSTTDKSVLNVTAGTLTLKDSNPNTTNYLTLSGWRCTGIADGAGSLNSGTGTGTLAVSGGCLTGGSMSGVNVSNGAKFVTDGGTIAGNTGTSGSGVYVADGGTFTMKAAAIKYNKVSGNSPAGGGVYVASGGTFNVSGAPVVTNNIAGADPNNVYLPDNKKITVAGPLDSTALIGVNLQNWPAGTADTAVISDGLYGNGNASNFSADKNGYRVSLNNYNEAVIGVAIHTHSYTGKVTKDPTCTEPGVRTYTCSGCGDSYTESIPALGHSYDAEGKVTTQPTLLTEGVRTFTCSRCGHKKTEAIPKLKPESQEEAEAINEIIEALTDENGNLKVEINATTVENEDGTTVTTVTIGGQEVIKIITDEDGDETVESNIWTIGGEDEDFTYTGAAVKPVIHVYDGIHKLSEGSEYAVKYGNNVNASEKAWIYVSFGGSYKGTPAKTVYFTIKPADLTKDATAENLIVASSKKLQAPIPTITLSNGTVINKQLAYRYLDKDGNVVKGVKDPGTYTLEAKAGKNNNNFVNTLSANITVTGEKVTPLSQARVLFSQKQYIYTGKPVTPGYTLYMGKEKLTEGSDFTVKSVTNNTKPGKARITFAAVDGNEKGLVGTKSAEFVISNGRVLTPQGEGSDFTYTIAPSTPYAKGGAKPFVTVKDGDYTLVYNKDYTISYDKNSKKITDKATAVVKGMGNYKGSVPVTFEVVKQDIAALSANIIVDDKAESKKGYENPVVTVTDLDGNKLKAGYDFTISDYSAPENGIVTAKLYGKGCYEGSVPISYRYIQVTQHLAKIKAVGISNKTYTGSRIKLTKKELNKLFYTVDKKAKKINYLEYGKDFEIVGYSNNTKAGVATVTLRGIGEYGGVRTLAFKITSAKKSIIDIILKK